MFWITNLSNPINRLTGIVLVSILNRIGIARINRTGIAPIVLVRY